MASQQKETVHPSKSPGVPDEITLEDIDKILEKDDPGFAQELQAIGRDDELKSAEIEPFHVEEVNLLTDDVEEVKIRYPRLHKLLAPIRWLKAWLALRALTIKNRFRLAIRNFVGFVRHELPDRLRYAQARVRAGFATLGKLVHAFKILPLKARLILIACFFLATAALLLMAWTFRGPILSGLARRPVTDLSKYAEVILEFPPDEPWVSFYQSFPQPEHVVLLPKFVINLRRTNASENPMGAFELFVAADSQSTAVEIRDREKELVDLISRNIEELTYGEIMGKLGSARIKARVREEINRALNQGRVDKVYIKTAITKP